MNEAKFIKKEKDIAEYEIDESNKEVADTEEYKAEKIEKFSIELQSFFDCVKYDIDCFEKFVNENEKIDKKDILIFLDDLKTKVKEAEEG